MGAFWWQPSQQCYPVLWVLMSMCVCVSTSHGVVSDKGVNIYGMSANIWGFRVLDIWKFEF